MEDSLPQIEIVVNDKADHFRTLLPEVYSAASPSKESFR